MLLCHARLHLLPCALTDRDMVHFGCYSILIADSEGILCYVQIEPFDREDYEDDAEFPDVAICPDSPHVVSVINADSKPRTFYLTLYHQCLDARGNLLQMGFTRDEKVRSTSSWFDK